MFNTLFKARENNIRISFKYDHQFPNSLPKIPIPTTNPNPTVIHITKPNSNPVDSACAVAQSET